MRLNLIEVLPAVCCTIYYAVSMFLVTAKKGATNKVPICRSVLNPVNWHCLRVCVVIRGNSEFRLDFIPCFFEGSGSHCDDSRINAVFLTCDSREISQDPVVA